MYSKRRSMFGKYRGVNYFQPLIVVCPEKYAEFSPDNVMPIFKGVFLE